MIHQSLHLARNSLGKDIYCICASHADGNPWIFLFCIEFFKPNDYGQLASITAEICSCVSWRSYLAGGSSSRLSSNNLRMGSRLPTLRCTHRFTLGLSTLGLHGNGQNLHPCYEFGVHTIQAIKDFDNTAGDVHSVDSIVRSILRRTRINLDQRSQ